MSTTGALRYGGSASMLLTLFGYGVETIQVFRGLDPRFLARGRPGRPGPRRGVLSVRRRDHDLLLRSLLPVLRSLDHRRRRPARARASLRNDGIDARASVSGSRCRRSAGLATAAAGISCRFTPSGSTACRRYLWWPCLVSWRRTDRKNQFGGRFISQGVAWLALCGGGRRPELRRDARCSSPRSPPVRRSSPCCCGAPCLARAVTSTERAA